MAWLGFNIARLVERFWKSIVKKKVTIQQLRRSQAAEFETILFLIRAFPSDADYLDIFYNMLVEQAESQEV